MEKFVGALQDRGLADRTVYHRFACLISFFKANELKVVALKDAPDYVEHEIRVYTQADLDALLAACTPGFIHCLLHVSGPDGFSWPWCVVFPRGVLEEFLQVCGRTQGTLAVRLFGLGHG